MRRSGRIPEAASFYEVFLANFGWHEPVAKALGDTYRTMGKNEKARDLYAAILNRCRGCHQRRDPAVKRRLADIDFDMQRHTTTTLELYLSLAQEDPDNRPTYFDRVSRIYDAMGNRKEALRFRELVRRVTDDG